MSAYELQLLSPRAQPRAFAPGESVMNSHRSFNFARLAYIESLRDELAGPAETLEDGVGGARSKPPAPPSEKELAVAAAAQRACEAAAERVQARREERKAAKWAKQAMSGPGGDGLSQHARRWKYYRALEMKRKGKQLSSASRYLMTGKKEELQAPSHPLACANSECCTESVRVVSGE